MRRFDLRMQLCKRRLIVLTIVILGLPPAHAQAAGLSILTPDGLFRVVSQVAEQSGPRIGSMVNQDYPRLPYDVTQIVVGRYPRLHADIYEYIHEKYPALSLEAQAYIYKRSLLVYREYQSDLVVRKPDIAAGRFSPSDLFWARVERYPALKLELINHLDRLHPELKFHILSRVDQQYPALKLDLFKLVVTHYPGLIWKVAKIWTDETIETLRK